MSRESLYDEINAVVKQGSELMTGVAQGYRCLSEKFKHEFVDHAVKYAEGKICTSPSEFDGAISNRRSVR